MQPDVQLVLICIQPNWRAKERTWAKRGLCFMFSTSVSVCVLCCYLHKEACPDCRSSSDTQSQWSQVERWSSQSKPWGHRMMVRLGNKCQHVLWSCQNSSLCHSQAEFNRTKTFKLPMVIITTEIWVCPYGETYLAVVSLLGSWELRVCRYCEKQSYCHQLAPWNSFMATHEIWLTTPSTTPLSLNMTDYLLSERRDLCLQVFFYAHCFLLYVSYFLGLKE